MVALLFMMLFLGPIEEFGWRGIAQPLLAAAHGAEVWAGMLMGRLGHLAPAGLRSGGSPSWRRGLLALLHRQHHAGSAGDADPEPVTGQPALADAVPLAAHQSVLAGRAAVGHMDPCGGRGGCRLVEP